MKAKKGTNRRRRALKSKKINPFELKFDRTKHNVLGKTKKRAYTGAPGLAKKRALENRSETLGKEWKQYGKVNKIVDHRLGIHDKTISEEERAARRFVAERLKSFKAANLDNGSGNTEEVLTHKGAALTSVQKYSHTMSDDDDEDDEIDANFVSVAHFGGGKPPDTDGNEGDRAVKRKDVIAEIIAKTKQQRFDKRMARDEIEDATQRLDEKWKELIQKDAVGSLVVEPGKKGTAKVLPDDYDTLFFELKTDHSKAKATDREKTEEEVAFEERQKLLKLENERLSRMEIVSKKQSSQSVDANAETPSKKHKVFEAVYDAGGRLINSDKVKKARIKIVRVDNESSDESLSMTESYDEGEQEDLDQMIQKEDEENAPGDVGSSELPFVFEMPNVYEEMKSILNDKSPSEISLVVSRLIKCHHPSLHAGNKKKLSRLLLYIIRFYDDLAREGAFQAKKLGFLHKSIFQLLKFNSEYGARCMRALLRQQRAVYARSIHDIFGFRPIALLMLVEKLFPVTDAFHPVCTPTLAFALSLVTTVRVCCIRDAARILLLVTVLSLYVEESKRYLPEVIAFLRGIFLVAVENSDEERTPTATFPISFPHRRMLLVESDYSDRDDSLVLDVKDAFEEQENRFEDNDHNRLRVLRVAVATTSKYVSIYSVHNNGFNAIFRPYLALLSRLPRKNYPKMLQEEILALESTISANCQKCASLKQLQRAKKNTKMLEMLDPRIEPHFNMEKKSRLAKENEKDLLAERRLLKRKVRKEMRGAIKELRKDTQFLAREKRRAIAEDDRIRKEKTNKLLRELQGQESEYKKYLFTKQKV